VVPDDPHRFRIRRQCRSRSMVAQTILDVDVKFEMG